MKTYKKTYYFDNGNQINIFPINKNFEEIMKGINKSLAAEFTNEIVDNIVDNVGKSVTINMNKVNYIVVEEVKSDNNENN